MLKPRAREELLSYLFESARATPDASAIQEEVAQEVSRWLDAQPLFGVFLQSNRDKVRKKLRTAVTADAARGTRAELRVACLLLSDKRFEIAYEAYGSGKGGPDLTITFRANQRFNVEVTHLSTSTTRPNQRNLLGAPTEPDQPNRPSPPILPSQREPSARLATVFLAKLRQLPPAMPNLLVVAQDAGESHIDAAVRQLKARAERKDDAFFTRYRYESARDFHGRFLRLSGVALLIEAPAQPTQPSGTLWLNREARYALPKPAITALLRCFGLTEG
jgi:hypothetical protein